MADKASRALVIFGDGFMPLITHSHSHIHSLASQASCGFLSLRDSPPRAENVDETAVSELLQLLDAYGYVQKKSEGFTTDATLEFKEDLLVPSLSERHHHPMLVAQWQEAVTRRDMARAFSFKEFQEYGGNLAILADRFLHELAFKLWKAPKYGA